MHVLLPTGLFRSYGKQITLLLLGVFLLPDALKAQAVQQASPWTQTLTADDLGQAGVHRLSDLFLLIDNVSAYSVDGYTWNASFNTLSRSEDNAWALIVDGVPQDFGAFGGQNINQLPFHVADIASLTIHRVPALVHGVFAQAGTIEIHTKNPVRGVAIQGSAAAGNEINDPGPFRFVDTTQVNIDRLGPPLYAAASVGGRIGSVKASFAADEHHATDAMMLTRVWWLYRGIRRPQLRLYAPRLSVQLNALGGTHHFVRSRSRLRDLWFFEPLGLELPLTRMHDHFSARGTLGDSTRSFTYRATYDRVHLDERLNRFDLDADWLQDRYSVHAAQHTQIGRWTNETGATLRARQSHTSTILLYDTLFETEGYTSWRWQPTPASHHQVAGFFSLINNTAGYKVLVTGAQALSASTGLHYTLSQEREAFDATNSLWFWARNGYRFLHTLEADFLLPLRHTEPQTTTVDLALRVQPMPRLGFTVAVSGRWFRGQTAPLYTFQYDAQKDGFLTSTRVATGLFGRVMGMEASVRFQPAAWMSHQLTYRTHQPSSTEAAFVALWDEQARHQTTLTSRFSLPARIQAFVRWHHIGPQTWVSFAPADAATTGRFGSERPAYLLLDLAVRKKFWGPRLTASLTLRNAFDAPYRPHPAGAALHATLFAQATLDLTALRW